MSDASYPVTCLFNVTVARKLIQFILLFISGNGSTVVKSCVKGYNGLISSQTFANYEDSFFPTLSLGCDFKFKYRTFDFLFLCVQCGYIDKVQSQQTFCLILETIRRQIAERPLSRAWLQYNRSYSGTSSITLTVSTPRAPAEL